MNEAALALQRKYAGRERGVPSRTHALAKKDNQYSVSLAAQPKSTNALGLNQDGRDFSYFITASFGAESKNMYLLFDTGAGSSWVMGSDCKTSACALHNTYGPESSTTFKASTTEFSINYGSGQVAGFLAQDTITLFPKLKVLMNFGVANTTSKDFENFPFDGILGMSLSKATTDNFMQTATDYNGLIPVFSVSLNRAVDGPNTGEVMFGSDNAAKYNGFLDYQALANPGNGDWAIPLNKFGYDQTFQIMPAGRTAYIDTGTTFIFGPPEDVKALHALIPGSSSADGVTYTVPCDSTKPLSVAFGTNAGVSWSIDPRDWMAAPSPDGRCVSNIYGNEVVKGSWLLGDTFLKNVYTVFDAKNQRIGKPHKYPVRFLAPY